MNYYAPLPVGDRITQCTRLSVRPSVYTEIKLLTALSTTRVLDKILNKVFELSRNSPIFQQQYTVRPGSGRMFGYREPNACNAFLSTVYDFTVCLQHSLTFCDVTLAPTNHRTTLLEQQSADVRFVIDDISFTYLLTSSCVQGVHIYRCQTAISKTWFTTMSGGLCH